MKSQGQDKGRATPMPQGRRNLNLCFSKMKIPLCTESPPSPPSSVAAAGTATATPTTSGSALVKNFNSLFDSTSKSLSSPSTSSSHSHSSTDPDPDLAAVAAFEHDLASAYASHRFFFSSPGRSNSIIESIPAPEPEPDPLVGDSVAVPTYSPDPYLDFRRSMQEMVDARQLLDVKSNWEYLHELLLCYLALNPKNTHKFIVGAFADLLVSLMCDGDSHDNRRGGYYKSTHTKSSCTEQIMKNCDDEQ